MSGRDTAMERARVMKGALLLFGVPEVSIELQPGRPSGGDDWNAVQPVGETSHHIVSKPTPENPTPGLALVKRGVPGLDGPLCNGTAGVDLVYRIITLGLANHPGAGGPLTLRGPMGAYTIPKDVARPYLWGTEYEGGYTDEVWDRVYTNRRTGQSMTFREFMGRANAGVLYGCWLINGRGRADDVKPSMDLSGYHTEHKTWAPTRKIDRFNYTTDSGRAEVRRFATMEDDMPTPADLWNHPVTPNTKDAKPIPARTMLAQTHKRSGEARAAAEAALAQAKRNRDAIAALAASLDSLAPGVAAEVVEALGDAIEVEVTVGVRE